jgi:two-component system, LytTR family, sensor kinase
MRYQIEGSQKDLLSLEDDLEFMHHYITVEQQRIKKRCKIEWIDKISIVQKEKYEIAPLLFLPFVENAVKHGSASVDMSEIKIVFSMHNSTLQFFCNNTIPKHKASTSNTGTGLNNVRNRLQILYPKLHELSITNDDHFFNVNLSIALKLKDEV